jgi:hypothetical protein
MSEYFEILDAEYGDPAKLKKGLKKLRIRILFVPIFILIAYLIVRITNAFEWKMGIAVVIGFWIGTILNVAFRERKAIYIYDYSLNEGMIKLFLVNVFGNTEELVLPINEIEKIKYRKKGILRDYGKVWIHLNGSVKELYFLQRGIGDELVEKMNV